MALNLAGLVRHNEVNTEQTCDLASYVFWLRRYMTELRQMPEGLSSEKKLEQFLTDLARHRDVSASTQSDSAGTSIVYELLAQHPRLWRGVILFSPTHFPDPARLPDLRIFIDNGGADPNFGKRGMAVPMDFQDAAASAGIPVTLIIHPGLGHIFRMPAGERERMREALIFLGGG